MQDQFVAQLEVIVRKKKMLKVTVDERWLSEKEMKEDFKWSPYFGQQEKSIDR